MKITMPALIVLFVAVGCGDGRNDCEIGEERVRACLNFSEDERPPPDIPVCEGFDLCFAACLNGSSCAAIKDRFSGLPTDLSKSLFACEAICKEKNP